MKCAPADIRSRSTERTAATGRSPIQTLKKPSAFSVSAKHSKHKKWLTPARNQRVSEGAPRICANLTSPAARYRMTRTPRQFSLRISKYLRRRSMKKKLIWCLLGLVLLVSAARSQSQKVGGDEKAVETLEQQWWLQGQKTNNPDLVSPLLADKIIVTEADGQCLNKDGMLAVYKKTRWGSAEYTDLKVTVFGDTAIATGGFNGKGTDATGKPFDVHERWTDTWVKMPDGKWQCVASQATPVRK